MSRKPIYVGSRPKLTAEIRLDGVLTDPSNLTLKIRKPNGTILTKTYAADITKASTGIYYFRQPIDASGVWWFKYIATGTAESATPATFEVIADPFV